MTPQEPPFFQKRLVNKQLFINRIKHYHQWLHTAIPLKAKLGQISSDCVRVQGPPKRPSSGRLYPVSSIRECYRKTGKCKISRVLQSPVSSPQASPRWRSVIDLSRLNTFLHVEKFKMETPESIRTSLVPGEWLSSIDLSDAYLHIPIHPNSRKYLRFCHRSQVFQFTSLPFLDTNSGVFVHGLRIPPRFSPYKTHSREMAQTSGFDPTTQIKTCFDCKIFEVANWVDSLNGEGGTPSHEALSISSQGALDISSVTGQPPSLDRSNFCTPTLLAEPHKCDDRCESPSQRPHSTLYRRLKRRLGHSLKPKFLKGSVVRQGKKATHKCSRLEGGLTGPSKFQGPVSGPNCPSCNGQLNSGSLHKQTERNSLSGDAHTPVEDHDLVPSLSHNIKSQTHCRVSECDGRPLSRSNQVQSTEWSLHPQVFKQICRRWFTPRVDRFATHLNHKLPLYVSLIPDPNAWDIDALNINWEGLTAYAYPPTALLHRVIQKIRQCHCLIILITPDWPGMPWFWDLVQLSTEVPLQLPVSTTLLKQSHNHVFHSNLRKRKTPRTRLDCGSGRENCCPSAVINKDHL